MTGRELIIYILENNLEDKEIFNGDNILGLMTIQQAAVKFGVGEATIKAWMLQGKIKHVSICGKMYIPANETIGTRKE